MPFDRTRKEIWFSYNATPVTLIDCLYFYNDNHLCLLMIVQYLNFVHRARASSHPMIVRSLYSARCAKNFPSFSEAARKGEPERTSRGRGPCEIRRWRNMLHVTIEQKWKILRHTAPLRIARAIRHIAVLYLYNYLWSIML